MLSKASSATSQDPDLVPIHAKYDNSRYSIVGRSYGVGSSVGLPANTSRQIEEIVEDVHFVPNLAQFSYEEIGYRAEVSCIVNQSSLWEIRFFFEDLEVENGTTYAVAGMCARYSLSRYPRPRSLSSKRYPNPVLIWLEYH